MFFLETMSVPIHFSKGAFVLNELMKRIQYDRILFGDVHQVAENLVGTRIVEHVFHDEKGKVSSFILHTKEAPQGQFSAFHLGGDLSFDYCVSSQEVQDYLVSLVTEYKFLTMFVGLGDSVHLGPFFSKQSELRTRLVDILEQQDQIPAIPISQKIWRAITDTGGIDNVRDIWDELFEEDIKIRMLVKYPFCFDVDIESILAN